MNLSLSGSGWPAVAAILAAAAGLAGTVLLVLYVRARLRAAEAARRELAAAHNVDRARVENDTWRSTAYAMARAISKQAAGPGRDTLIKMVGRDVPDRRAWDEALEGWGLRVHASAETDDGPALDIGTSPAK